ncbi:MAG: hypothetical protein AB1351_03200 [Thermoproteota archaeon]
MVLSPIFVTSNPCYPIKVWHKKKCYDKLTRQIIFLVAKYVQAFHASPIRIDNTARHLTAITLLVIIKHYDDKIHNMPWHILFFNGVVIAGATVGGCVA